MSATTETSGASGTTRGSRRVRGVSGATTTGGLSTRSGRRASEAPPRAARPAGLVDGVVMLVLLAAVAAAFSPVWGSTGWVRPTAGGALLGLLVAWLCAWRRWPTLVTALATVVAYLVAGAGIALPSTAASGVLPTLDSVRGLAVGAVHGWKEFVTTSPPLHSFPDLAVVPFLTLYLTAVVAGTIAWRARLAAWALVPVAAGLVGANLLGTKEGAWPVEQGLAIGVVGLLWGALRVIEQRVGRHTVTTEASRQASRRLRWYRFRTGATILGLGAIAAALAAPALAPAHDRATLRDVVVPPLDVHPYVSPLTAFRKYAKDDRKTELLTIDGLPAGQRVRLAALDAYDGVVYDASGEGDGGGVFHRAGDDITASGGGPAGGTATQVDVHVLGYSGPWIPEAGALTGITWTGTRAAQLLDDTYYDALTRTALTTGGLQSGDSYRLDTDLVKQPTEAQLKAGTILTDTQLPPIDDHVMPTSAAAKATQFMGDATDPVKRLFALRDGLVASGVFSSGLENQAPSRPGHSAERIDTLLAGDSMVGDDEQFAVALALMARQAGIPARVAMGFYVDPKKDTRKDGQPWTVVGGDVHAWVEVPFQGYGWVPIDAVPDEDNKIQPEPKSQQVPKPPVLQDPQPPQEPADDVPGNVKDDKSQKQQAKGFDWGFAGVIAASVGIPLVLVLGPVALVLGLKSRRRLHRRRAPRPSDRMSGGWREVLDTARDLGATVPPGATRRESAHALAQALEAPATLALAYRADASVFGASEPSDADVDEYWADVDAYLDGVKAGIGRRRRLRAALSLRSLRGEHGRAALRALFRRPPAAGAGGAR